MKYFIICITFVLISGSTFAQVDRTQYPEPAPAPEIQIGSAKTFTLPNGLQVFVVENHKLPRIALSLVFDRDPIFEGDKAGVMGLFGDMMMGGTSRYSKDKLNEAIDQIGAKMSFGSGSASASALTKYQDTLMEIFKDVLLHPVFPQAELDKLKKMKLSDLEYAKNDPGTISRVVRNAVMYGKDHPYGESVTSQTVQGLEVEDFVQFYNTYYKPNGAYLAIVGDITFEVAQELVAQYLSEWETGEVPTHAWAPSVAPSSNQVVLVNRPSSVQSVINVSYPISFTQNSPDRIAVTLLNYILGGGSSSRLFMNLREDKGYTYGAYSSISPDRLVGEFSANASVRTAVTDSAIYEFLAEMRRLNAQTIETKELDLAKAAISGHFARSLENPGTIASFAISQKRYNLPEDYYANFLKNVDAVSLEDLNDLVPKYIKPENAYIVVVGNTQAIEGDLGTYGTVSHYGVDGNPLKEVTVDIQPEQVIERYMDAIGGREKLETVLSMKQVASGEVQGTTLSQEFVVDKQKGLGVQRTFMGGQEVSKVLISREKVRLSAMGKEQELPQEAVESFQNGLKIFPELDYHKDGASLTLLGVEEIDGVPCYKLSIDQNGIQTTEYFSVESALKLRVESTLQGQANFGGYQDFDGVKVPTELGIMLPNMPMEIKMIISEILVNPVLEATDLQ